MADYAIQGLTNFDSNGKFIEKKRYKYGVNENNNGSAAAYPTAEDFCQTNRILQQYEDEHYTRNLGSVIKQKTYMAFPKRNYFTSSSSVVYPTVTEYVVDSLGNDYGKTVYNYTYYPTEWADYYDQTTARAGSIDMPIHEYEWKNGLLTSKRIYRKENNVYTEIYSLSNTYQYINTEEYMNLRVLPYIQIYGVGASFGSDTPENIMKCFDLPNCSVYQQWFSLSAYSNLHSPYNYFNYYTSTGLPVVSSTTVYQDGVSTTTNYYNHNSTGLPSKVSTVLSSESTQTDSLLYASGLIFDSSGQIVSCPVSTKMRYQNNVFLEKEVTNFTTWPSGFAAPASVQYQSKTGNLETRLMFDYDTKGNPKTVVKDDTEKLVYIWGYNNLYPIAKIENVNYTQIPAAVTAIADKLAPTDADWSALNNLRTSLSDALVTIYKYSPLIGMTEMINPRGVKTTYEYDSLGRLQNVKDENGKTIETYDYHYKE